MPAQLVEVLFALARNQLCRCARIPAGRDKNHPDPKTPRSSGPAGRRQAWRPNVQWWHVTQGQRRQEAWDAWT